MPKARTGWPSSLLGTAPMRRSGTAVKNSKWKFKPRINSLAHLLKAHSRRGDGVLDDGFCVAQFGALEQIDGSAAAGRKTNCGRPSDSPLRRFKVRCGQFQGGIRLYSGNAITTQDRTPEHAMDDTQLTVMICVRSSDAANAVVRSATDAGIGKIEQTRKRSIDGDTPLHILYFVASMRALGIFKEILLELVRQRKVELIKIGDSEIRNATAAAVEKILAAKSASDTKSSSGAVDRNP